MRNSTCRLVLLACFAVMSHALHAQSEILLEEDFEGVIELPDGWTVDERSEPGGRGEWLGWKLLEFDDFRDEGGPRDRFWAALQGRGPVADSDLYGHADFDSSLLSPAIDVGSSLHVALAFDSGYRHNSNQRAEVECRFDGGGWRTLVEWFDGDGVHLDEEDDHRRIVVGVRVEGGASRIAFRWRLRENFGWYWGIDNVQIVGLGGLSSPPATPRTVSPVSLAQEVPPSALLEGSTFEDPDDFDAMGGSQWQVVVAGESFEQALHDSGFVANDATVYVVPPGTLGRETTYAWRLRYRDIREVWSDWSSPATFTTISGDGLLFTNIQRGSNVTEVSSRGGAWGDYDGDGFQDLWTGSTIYRNLDGSGAFEKIVTLEGTKLAKAGTAWADYNNDGRLDLFVGSQWLYENRGDDEFLRREKCFGLRGNFASQAVCWGDYDGDGWVDVYVVGDHGAVGALYRNLNGTGFRDVTPELEIFNLGEGYGGAWADYDNDGDLDLFVANCDDDRIERRQNSLYENRGGTFVERAAEVGLLSTENSWASAWGDYDNDGDLDLYVVNTSGPDHFYRNDDGTFVDLRGQAGLPEGSNREAVWGDYDNDGDLDLYLCRTDGANLLFRNDGGEIFTEIGEETGVDDDGAGRVASIADFDNDGDLDIFVGNSGGTPIIYRNDLGPSNWLILRLVGTVSNRSAIGARVYATTGERRQLREVSGGGGLYTQRMLPVHFGLGAAEVVDRVEIRWPSGAVQILNDVASNQILSVVETSPAAAAVFIRADSNCDGLVDIADPVHTLFFLFVGGAPAPCCLEAANTNGDSEGELPRIDISDVISTLSYLLLQGTPPPPPFPDCETTDISTCPGHPCAGG